ncbi:MAG: metal ABC transporter substrate-binding protein [Elusimicrobiales bacterium]|nr:metal ABC transporter substrate-binding protein [Elusimicrobiales bacterium]
MLKKIILIAAIFCLPSSIWAKPATAVKNIVASSQDLAYIAARVGGRHVTVKSLTSGDEDQHYVEARPSMVMALRNADVFVRIGMELDMWADALMIAAKNDKIMRGGSGEIDASADIEKLQVPSGKIDMSMGDIHAFGNPHYWLDPQNAAVIAKTIAARLSQIDPANAQDYNANAKAFSEEIAAKLKAWQKRLEPYAGYKIVVYHDSWPYFAKRFNLIIAGHIEPKPGIPPSPSHIASLIDMMRREKVKAILCETYFNGKTTGSLSEKTGVNVAAVPVSAGGVKGTETYEKFMDYIVTRLEEAFRK